jgi:dihydroorotate dehydrogenase subfamily 2
MGMIFRALTHPLYKAIAKPIFFRRDPEDVHDHMTKLGAFLGHHAITRALTRFTFSYQDPRLTQTIHGVTFPNPVGLAAGFDKNAELVDIMGSVGFGWVEIGSVTGEPCPGNAKPRLWRLPKSQSLVVYYGLKNDGAESLAKKLLGRAFDIPVGVSVAKTNSPDACTTEAGVADYTKAFRLMEPVAKHMTVNISCPNTFGGEPFADPVRLELLLTELDRIPTEKPVFLKLPADISLPELDALVAVAAKHRVHGLISSNLTKDRKNPNIKDANVPDKGGMSGKLSEPNANKQLEHLARTTQKRFILVGVGGIFSAEDAYKKIRLGASLVQLITGMIFEGPQLIGDINAGLVKLLERDGFKNISEAIGADIKR